MEEYRSLILTWNRNRLAIWAFNLDSCFAVMYNSCPLLAIAELNIDFPCQEAIFDAETATEYEKLTTSDYPESSDQPRSPSQSMKILLHNTWSEKSLNYATAWDLMVVMCGTYKVKYLGSYFILTLT